MERVVIIKLDAIGDYILIRNFLEEFRKSEKFQNCEITFLGNSILKDFVETFDSEIFNKFIWIDISHLTSRKFFFQKLLFQIKLLFREKYDLLINCTHSRDERRESIINCIRAKQKIASIGDLANYKSPNKLQIGNKKYTDLVPIRGIEIFEFERNRDFFEFILDTKLSTKLQIQSGEIEKSNELVIFPGAGNNRRIWNYINYVSLLNLLPNGLYVKFLGGNEVNSLVSNILASSNSNNTIINLCGKTNIIQLVNQIQNARLVLTSDSSALHIAAATNTDCICISNGNHFGRFHPYPKKMDKPVHIVYPHHNFYNQTDFSRLIELTKIESNFNIDDITVNEVFKLIQKFLKV